MIEQSAIDGLRRAEIPPQALFIDGRWQQGETGETIEAISPIDGKVLTTLARASRADVDRAVRAGRAAFEAGHWSRMPPAGRKKVLLRIAEIIEARALELAVLGVRENVT